MYCGSCGKQIDDDSKFCPFCGATIDNSTQNASSDSIPSFTAPDADVPQFTAPGSADGNKTVANDDAAIPQFKAPGNDIPTFTAPQRQRVQGPVCYYHEDEPAVGRCARCGKNLCQDCCDSYGVTSGQYAGKYLCYDCTQELVQENVNTLQANYATIKSRYITCVIGCVIGALIGLLWGSSGGAGGSLVYGILCAAIGGSAGNFFRSFFAAVPSFFVSTGNIVLSLCIGLAKFVICFFVYALKALVETIQKISYYVSYMKRTQGFIESDSAALRQMQEYMDYTMIRQKNRGVDLETLMQQGSQLYNNSFAQMVRDQGEDQAEAYMRQCVTRIAENGEIIRDFAA